MSVVRIGRSREYDLPEHPPNSWSIVHEYSRTVVTLASALLAVTVTFSEKVINARASPTQRDILVGTWVVLFLAIISALLAAAFLSTFLRKGRKANAAILCSNFAFLFLVAAAGGFLVLGTRHVNRPPDRSYGAVLRRTVTLLDSVRPSGRWRVLEWWSLPPDTIVVVMTSGTDTSYAYVRFSDDEIVKLTGRR